MGWLSDLTGAILLIGAAVVVAAYFGVTWTTVVHSASQFWGGLP